MTAAIADDIDKAKEIPPTFINLIKLRPRKIFDTNIIRLENKIISTLPRAVACLKMMVLKIKKGSWIILYLITLPNPKIVAFSIMMLLKITLEMRSAQMKIKRQKGIKNKMLKNDK